MSAETPESRPGVGRNGFYAGCLLLVMLCLAGVLAPWLAPHDPDEQYLSRRLAGPCREFPLGADGLGRCVASRLLYGVRPTLGLAAGITVLVAVLGLGVGLAAATSPRIDGPLMRLTDSFLAFPPMVLALVVVGVIGPGAEGIILALTLPGWPKYARVVRTTALSLSRRTFVEATRAIGAGPLYVLWRCYLPGLLGPVGAIATVGMGGKIVSIAGLGLLGLGLPPPTPEWGGMMQKGLPVLGVAPHVSLAPGLAIALATLAFTLAGEGLRDILDPALDAAETAWRR